MSSQREYLEYALEVWVGLVREDVSCCSTVHCLAKHGAYICSVLKCERSDVTVDDCRNPLYTVKS